MPNETHYGAIVLGGGMAGLPIALKLGFKGFKVALIERNVERNDNVKVIRGEARFTGPKTLDTNGDLLTGGRGYLASTSVNHAPR
jgi:pyruvate/2-oxoglutarate dehydrogenase complex dihydrolipoamide dehydrogenase (E3) component